MRRHRRPLDCRRPLLLLRRHPTLNRTPDTHPPRRRPLTCLLPVVLLAMVVVLPAATRARDDGGDAGSGRGWASGHEAAGMFHGNMSPNGTPRALPRSAATSERRRLVVIKANTSSLIGGPLEAVRRSTKRRINRTTQAPLSRSRKRSSSPEATYNPAKCRNLLRRGYQRRTVSLPGGTKVVVSRSRTRCTPRAKNGRKKAIDGPRDRKWRGKSGGRCCNRNNRCGRRDKWANVHRGRRRRLGGQNNGRRRGGGRQWRRADEEGGRTREEHGRSVGSRREEGQFFVAVSSRRKIMLKGSSRYTNARLYGRWSRWSPCSRSCTTQRFRWCKKPLQCGSDVVREEAYCYVEGSFCHRWIHRRIHQQPDKDDNEADIDPLSEESETQLAYGNNPTHIDLWSQKDCGIPLTNRTTSFLSFRRHQQALRIIGGRESLPGQWPWQVAVLNRFKEAFCGGTLVAPQWVLTAAHCIRKRLYVRLGEHDLAEEDGTEAEFRVEEAVIHPEYDADTVDNDVALLRLPSWASSTRTMTGGIGIPQPLACLPRPRQALPLRRLCTIIGWGKRKSSDAFGTDVLHEAEVPIVSNEVCRDVYEDYYITGNMFCAGYHKGRMDSCAGDSGGPLLCLSSRGPDGLNPKWTIFGITSFGEGCGKRGKYGIYTKVSNYVRWVQRVVKGYLGSGKY